MTWKCWTDVNLSLPVLVNTFFCALGLPNTPSQGDWLCEVNTIYCGLWSIPAIFQTLVANTTCGLFQRIEKYTLASCPVTSLLVLIGLRQVLLSSSRKYLLVLVIRKQTLPLIYMQERCAVPGNGVQM